MTVITPATLKTGWRESQKTTVALYKGKCAACSAKLKANGQTWAEHGQAVDTGVVCPACGALHAHANVQAHPSLRLFSLFADVQDPESVYFDVTFVDRDNNPTRRSHGWADKRTGYVFQIG